MRQMSVNRVAGNQESEKTIINALAAVPTPTPTQTHRTI